MPREYAWLHLGAAFTAAWLLAGLDLMLARLDDTLAPAASTKPVRDRVGIPGND